MYPMYIYVLFMCDVSRLYFRVKHLKVTLTAFPFLSKVMMQVLTIRQMDFKPS